jgi:hypothetical protein
MASRETHRVFFGEYGDNPPWTCELCGDPILMRGQSSEALNVHHINKDVTDNRLENLMATHHRCHISHHFKGVPVGPMAAEQRERLSEAQQLRWSAAEPERREKVGQAGRATLERKWQEQGWREKMASAVAASNKRRGPTLGMTGKQHSEETRAKMRAAHTRRKQLEVLSRETTLLDAPYKKLAEDIVRQMRKEV